MGKPQVVKKRVYAVRRAPDGSAFEKCDGCGVSVAIALLDMHEYECGGKVNKKSRGDNKELDLHDQPRSPFCFFMENYMENCKSTEWIEIGRAAFEIWVNMAPKEKRPFIKQAEQVNSAYLRTLLEEVRSFFGHEDEADSAMVGKFDPDHEPSASDEHLQWGHHGSFECSDSFDLYISPHCLSNCIKD